MRSRFVLLPILVVVGAALLWWAPDVTAQDAPACANAATLVEKQLPDPNQPLAPGDAFTVTWQLENTGDCDWTRAYRLLPVDGERMGGKPRYLLTTTVRPGRHAVFTLALVAPDEPGFHQGIWRLSDAAGGVPFGPWLAIEVEVTAPAATTAVEDDVILPEVLVLGGRGGGGGDYVADPCLVDDARVTEPTLVLEDDPANGSRSAYGYICGYPLDMEVTVTLTGPSGETFTRVYTVEEANITPEEGDPYTRPLLLFSVAWPDRAPSGRWIVTITGGDAETTAVLTVPEPIAADPGDYPGLDTYPVGSIDPFAAREGCRYAYTPGEQFIIAGNNFSRTTTIHLGVYQERAGLEYQVDSFRVTTDRRGEFTKLYTAGEPTFNYALHVIHEVDPNAYLEGGQAYDPFIAMNDADAWGCFTVKPDPDASPFYLAYVEGEPGQSDVRALHVYGGYTDAPSYSYGACDATNPVWWPGGAWVIYSSNCAGDPAGDDLHAAADYDLYAYEVFVWNTPGGSPITDTPDLNETEPDIARDGRIVYRVAPAGTPPGVDGSLWVLSAAGDDNRPLDVRGRAPAWSPAGTQIAYMSDVSGDWQVYVYDLDRDASRLVSVDCPGQCRFPAWSPDGDWLIYNTAVSQTDLTATGLWLAPADGGAPRLWLDGPYGHPSWSETGWIAFTGLGSLYRARAEAAAPVPTLFLLNAYVTDRPFWDPVWSR